MVQKSAGVCGLKTRETAGCKPALRATACPTTSEFGFKVRVSPNAEMEWPRKGAKHGFGKENGSGSNLPNHILPRPGSLVFFAPLRG